jgi:hypothetical protein
MLFDFVSYLHRLDPSQSWSVQSLPGGLVNFTVRAIKSRPASGSRTENKSNGSGPWRFAEHDSLILKYAPPYIAALGEGAPFDRLRQVGCYFVLF